MNLEYNQLTKEWYFVNSYEGPVVVHPSPEPFSSMPFIIIGSLLCLTIIGAPLGVKLISWAGQKKNNYMAYKILHAKGLLP